MKYQVISKCKAEFLIERDALKTYSIDIEESSKTVIVKSEELEIFRIFIVQLNRINSRKHDARVYFAHEFNIPSRFDILLSIRFQKLEKEFTLLFSSKRFIEPTNDVYKSSVYALFNDETNHMVFINSSDRSLELFRDEVLDTFESIESNTSFTYFTKSMSSQSKSILDSRLHDSHSHSHSSTYHVKADSYSQSTLKQSPSITAESQYAELTS